MLTSLGSSKPPSASAIYGDKAAPVRLRIGTGGAGESGLLQALVEASLEFRKEKFAVEWYSTHTSDSVEYLRQGIIDVAITYHAVAELVALERGAAERIEYAWRDHWMLVGPRQNPAQLPINGNSSIYSLFTKLQIAMEIAQSTSSPIRFLSRYDKSACNIKESSIFSAIGQTPWVDDSPPWYHKARNFPFEALRRAAALGEYTLTDRGTWCAIGSDVREKLMVFAQGSGAESDPLLNPAHLLIAADSKNKDKAHAFATWLSSREGGQDVVKRFERHGQVLYEPAPEGIDPLGQGKILLNLSLGDQEGQASDTPEK